MQKRGGKESVCERASVRESEVECVRQRGKEKLYEIERERERESCINKSH
jgi:hypothetical protein